MGIILRVVRVILLLLWNQLTIKSLASSFACRQTHRSHIITSHSSKHPLLSSAQTEYMIKDQCIAVSPHDLEIGAVSKHDAHRFTTDPSTTSESCPLHRAFSVFLFNQDRKLLIQKRASDKITFPDVWSNTCCSHPLYGQIPNEIDSKEDIARGHVHGIKHAAQRKLKHELGIDPKYTSINSMKYITRIHYSAKDELTYGPSAVWGEHEIDYILFSKTSNDIPLRINPEEVGDIKWVTPDELRNMMDIHSGLKWSPWFRVIAEKLLHSWWKDLDSVFNTNKYDSYDTIHRYT